MDSLRGKLLVAGPTLLDPNFRRTVVLICEHNDDGALGLVVDRVTTVEASEAIPELADVLGAAAAPVRARLDAAQARMPRRAAVSTGLAEADPEQDVEPD